jgi:peptidoglycan/LPS O-acetylase OafA/YrhL
MALWVAFGHGFQDFIHVVNNHRGYAYFLPQPFYQQAFFAHFAVDIFIVLSGFCLMLPVARSDRFEMSGGWHTFLLRRAQRILPPYYAALILAALLSYFRKSIAAPGPEAIVIQQIDFRPSAVLAHIFLVQNLWDPWAMALDGPTWSVATEFQIYILFPLLLLPLWRQMKPMWVIAVASLLGVGIYFFTPFGLTACSWYLGLFAMGMLAAQWHVRSSESRNLQAVLTAALAMIVAGVILIVFFDWMPLKMWALDLIFGSAAALLLVYFGNEQIPRNNVGKQLLEWPPLVKIGKFSYSLYLIHAPLLYVPTTILLIFRANELVGGTTLLISFIAIIFIARLFYEAIELPCMPKSSRSA